MINNSLELDALISYFDGIHGIIYNPSNGESRLLSAKTYKNLVSNSLDSFDLDLKTDLLKNFSVLDVKAHNELLQAQFRNNNNRKILRVRIITTTICNAKCAYCYEKGLTKISLDYNTADRLIDYILLIIDRYNYEGLQIEWFGGEPLMHFDIIKYIIFEIKSKNSEINITSNLITNGLLLDENKLSYLLDEANLRFIQITLEGTRGIYERIKGVPLGSFDKIMKIIKRIAKEKIKIAINLNYDQTNYTNICDLIDYLGEMHLPKNVIVLCNPIFNDNDHKEFISVKEQFESFILYKLYKNNFITLKDIIPKPINHPCIAKSSNFISFYPNGKVYICNRKYDDTIIDNFLTPAYNFEALFSYKKYYEGCNCCKLFPICFGGCPYERTLNKSGCFYSDTLIKKRLQLVVEILEKELLNE